MIRSFLRPPSGAAEWVADAVRAVGVVSVVAAFLWWTPTDAGILALAVPALLVPRFVGVRPGLDIAYGVTVLVAAWSNVLHLYRSVPWWDLVNHFACTGVLAAMLYLALSRSAVLPAPLSERTRPITPLVIVAAFGLALSAIWEIVEWAGKTFITDEISVSYADTIGDMAVGGLGGLIAGFLVARVRLLREPIRHAPSPSAAVSD